MSGGHCGWNIIDWKLVFEFGIYSWLFYGGRFELEYVEFNHLILAWLRNCLRFNAWGLNLGLWLGSLG